MMLEILDVTVGYQEDIDIVVNLSLKVEKASIVSLIGPNGAGKSTLLKAVIGFLRPKNGKIIYDSESIVDLPPYTLMRKGISYMPQQHNAFPQLTVEENLMMGAWTFRKDRERVMDTLEHVYNEFPNLSSKRRKKAVFLSGGELRMLDLAKVLMVKPKLLLVDEPTVGLAPKIADQMCLRIKALKEWGTSILLVDQNIRKAVDLADYTYLIELGRNKLEGPRETFKERLGEIIHKSLLG